MKRNRALTWHGHRGCRGLLPENSIPAFLRAIDLGMDALEMDVVISKDKQVVIAHEPYMPANICQKPDGSPIPQEEELSFNLYAMDYDQIRGYNCGLKHPRFPEQAAQEVHRPLLSELFERAETYCEGEKNRTVNYTIELKSLEKYDKLYHPDPKEFVDLVMRTIDASNLVKRCVLQSFDFRILRAINALKRDIKISMLLAEPFNLDKQLDILGFVPSHLGPKFDLLDHALVQEAQSKGMKVVPWTVNEVQDMKRVIAMGVDGIITDYPNRKVKISG